MAAQVNSVLKNRKSKDTTTETITFERLATAPKPRRKKPTKKAAKKPKQSTVNLTNYGYAIPSYDFLAQSMLGDRVPEDLESQVKYYKDKYEYYYKRSDTLKEQVQLLTSIIDSGLTRSCSGRC